ncbi:hypothetical protein A3A79_05395 [Candidatus Gottesmanbacteria bacterium RIFCSPLOWO2_01_FULL_43_11b]|uniref:Uncharacterized protein n=1 Tax=Candidatus Gottesmanbacteria bacterium RIFCSPLOWO2_01_FULL_43_11b TaxID=1798392 RepID=A0A1F6AIQ5_9BACT|nr:MAG: hypothetical protein A3A79_05395 [Candidatus Gottesmanbacteria bacterium RIFCSPLOWO2_01_FULL_43_11b]
MRRPGPEIIILSSLFLGSCNPVRATQQPEIIDTPSRFTPALPIPSMTPKPEQIPSAGIHQIEPGEILNLEHFTFENQMRGYSVRIVTLQLNEVSKRYDVPLDVGQDTTIILSPEIFEGENGSAVRFFDEENGKQRIEISGGLFEQVVSLITGRVPRDLRDQTLLSVMLSEKMIFALARIAEQRGQLPEGSSQIIESQYIEDILNLEAKLVAGMQILGNPLPEPAEPPPGNPPSA